MVREYHKGFSTRLGREMETLLFGHAGLPVVVFPTSGGRFFEFEDRGMVAALAEKIDAGQLRLLCVDSVDLESWYNRAAAPRARIQRHMLYEEYVLDEAIPLLGRRNSEPNPERDSDSRLPAPPGLTALGCSFGGYHAVNISLRHPEIFSGVVSFSGVFDLTGFLGGYYDQDCYYHLPTHYLPNLTDPWFLDRYRRNRCVLATGWDDQCLAQNQNLDRILTEKQIPHQLCVWDAQNSHDWPTWQRMARLYL